MSTEEAAERTATGEDATVSGDADRTAADAVTAARPVMTDAPKSASGPPGPDAVDVASADSFPASDPPSWTAVTGVGRGEEPEDEDR